MLHARSCASPSKIWPLWTQIHRQRLQPCWQAPSLATRDIVMEGRNSLYREHSHNPRKLRIRLHRCRAPQAPPCCLDPRSLPCCRKAAKPGCQNATATSLAQTAPLTLRLRLSQVLQALQLPSHRCEFVCECQATSGTRCDALSFPADSQGQQTLCPGKLRKKLWQGTFKAMT